MKKIIFSLLVFFSGCNLAIASTVTLSTIWTEHDIVTNAKLNNNNYNITGALNGGLDNDNANTIGGYRFIEKKSSLPVAGTQGRTVFLTSDNSLNFDTGATFVKAVTPSGTLATGQIPFYNSSWTLLSPGTNKYPLVSTGVSSLPAYQQLDLTAGVTGALPIANGGSGQITAQAAIDAFLPSQGGNSGKSLTTNGTTSSWGSTGALQFVSSTAVSAATTSGNISISPGEYYFVSFGLYNVGAGAGQFALRFNGSSGTEYDYAYSGNGGSAAMTTARGSSATSGLIGTTIVNSGTSQALTGNFYISPDLGASNNHWAFGKTSGRFTTVGFGYADFSVFWSKVETLSSFSIICDNNFTGTIYLYKLSQS